MSLGTPRRMKTRNADVPVGNAVRMTALQFSRWVRRQAQVTESHSEPRDGATREELRLTQLASCAG